MKWTVHRLMCVIKIISFFCCLCFFNIESFFLNIDDSYLLYKTTTTTTKSRVRLKMDGVL